MARFPARARLRRPPEFKSVMDRGVRISDKLLNAVVLGGSAARPRLGLAISTRAAPRAVDRNRIKRAVRESFRLQSGRLPATDIVILARPAAAAANAAELKLGIERLWQRLADKWPQCPKS